MLKNIYKDSYSFWDIFTKSMSIFGQNFKNIALIVMLVYIPINVALFFLWDFFLNSPDVTFKDASNYMKIAWRLENLIWVIASIFIILLVKDHIDNEISETNSSNNKTFAELLKSSLSKWAKAVWWNILYSIWVWFLTLLFIIPWVIFATFWAFFLYAIVLRDSKVWASFEYSKKLVTWRWWEIFLYVFFSFAVIMLVAFWSWYIPNIENMYMDIGSNFLIDFLSMFMIVIFTLKFLNIDKNIEKQKEVISNTSTIDELNSLKTIDEFKAENNGDLDSLNFETKTEEVKVEEKREL